MIVELIAPRARCMPGADDALDGLPPDAAIAQIARHCCEEFGATLDGWHARQREYYPLLCVSQPFAEFYVRAGLATPRLAEMSRLSRAVNGRACWMPDDDKLRDHCAPCWVHVLFHQLSDDPEAASVAAQQMERLWPQPCTGATCTA